MIKLGHLFRKEKLTIQVSQDDERENAQMKVILTPMQKHALSHISYHASLVATRKCVSPFSEQEIDIAASSVSVRTREELANIMQNPSADVTVLRVPLEGTTEGDALLVLESKKALGLADIFLAHSIGTTTEMSEYVGSAISEMGRVAMMVYVNMLMKVTERRCNEALPTLTSGPWDQLQEKLLAPYKSHCAIIDIQLRFSSKEETEKEVVSRLKVIEQEKLYDDEQKVDDDDTAVGEMKITELVRVLKTGRITKMSEEDIRKSSMAISNVVSLMPSRIEEGTKVLCEMGPAAVIPLLTTIKQSTAKTRFTLIEALVALGEPAVPALKEALDGADPETARAIGVVLERVEGTAPEAASQPRKAEEKDKTTAGQRTENKADSKGQEKKTSPVPKPPKSKEAAKPVVSAHLLIIFQKGDMGKILEALE